MMMNIFKRRRKGKAVNEFVKEVGTITGDLGRGIFAGFTGTLAMTLSQVIEMKLTNRNPSDTPVKGAEKVLGFHANEEDKGALNNIIHYSYGTFWGIFRGILGTLGVKSYTANSLHYASILGTEFLMLPKLEIAPPVREWGAKSISVSGIHHLVYAIVSGVVFDALKNRKLS